MTYRDQKDATIASLTAKLEAAEAQIEKLSRVTAPPAPPSRLRLALRRAWARRKAVGRTLGGVLMVLVIGAAGALLVYGVYRGVAALAAMHPLPAGYVIGKTHIPSSTTTTTDSKGHVHTHFHPAQWYLTIGYDNDTRRLYVSHTTYDATLQGDWACADEDARCVEPPPSQRH